MRKAILITPGNDEINPYIVALTSLCENNEEHFDIFINSDNLDDSCIDTFKNALRDYDITIKSMMNVSIEDAFELSVDMLIDGDIRDILEGTAHIEALVAPDAHNKGLTCQDIRGRYPVIVYPEDKPWLSTNIHYDIEGIWWEYAKKTIVYRELMETFLESSMTETFLEDYAIGICEENDKISETINKTKETINMLLK